VNEERGSFLFSKTLAGSPGSFSATLFWHITFTHRKERKKLKGLSLNWVGRGVLCPVQCVVVGYVGHTLQHYVCRVMWKQTQHNPFGLLRSFSCDSLYLYISSSTLSLLTQTWPLNCQNCIYQQCWCYHHAYACLPTPPSFLLTFHVSTSALTDFLHMRFAFIQAVKWFLPLTIGFSHCYTVGVSEIFRHSS